MEQKEQLYEGKAKKVFATDDPELLIVAYKDDATAFNDPADQVGLLPCVRPTVFVRTLTC